MQPKSLPVSEPVVFFNEYYEDSDEDYDEDSDEEEYHAQLHPQSEPEFPNYDDDYDPYDDDEYSEEEHLETCLRILSYYQGISNTVAPPPVPSRQSPEYRNLIAEIIAEQQPTPTNRPVPAPRPPRV
jgi:hypothetical protein